MNRENRMYGREGPISLAASGFDFSGKITPHQFIIPARSEKDLAGPWRIGICVQ